jgi:ABC-type branched-subunit amino acid transport system ATPase component
VLLIEQKLTIAMDISDRALVMGHGSIVFQGTPDSLRADSLRPQGVAGGLTRPYNVRNSAAR